MTRTCGIHLTHTWPCIHCSRAHAANTDALRDVTRKAPTAGRPKRVGQTDAQRAGHQYAAHRPQAPR